MSAEDVPSLSREFLHPTSPVAFVLLIILAGLVVYVMLKAGGFIFMLGVKTASRNPWKRARADMAARDPSHLGRRPLVRAIAGALLVVASVMLWLGQTRDEIAVGRPALVPCGAEVERFPPVAASVIGPVATDALPQMPLGLDSSGLPRPPSVDLLGLIDPRADAVAGVWQFKESKLITTGKPFDRIVIPYLPPEEYDVVVVADRQVGSNSLNLGLAVGEVQFVVILDASISGEFVSGLDLVDGKSFYGNETTVKGEQVVKGRPNRILCSVRKSHITVSVNGKAIIQWKADYKRLSLYTGWKVPRKDTLFIGTWTGVVQYHSLTLQAVSAQGKRLREAPKKVDTAPSEKTSK